ncbi:MAG: ThiF family adenylyltransferase [Bacteroidetes bacterium]|nr:MAG: ThiF family adenylyltransferase [Bacteroidota bacterium]
MKYNLTISGQHYQTLKQHLYPGDGNEAVAVAICGRHKSNEQTRLLIYEIIPIPYEHCFIREPDVIKWSTKIIIPYLEKASIKGLALLKIHSHPTGLTTFSETDNESDRELFESVYGWMDDNEPHASAIMLPDGKIFGRVFHPDMTYQSINKINVVGDDLHFWFRSHNKGTHEFEKRTAQAFGVGTTQKLNKLKIAVVGCSGTGSPLIEQLVRLGVGHLVLIDPDIVEEKNLNRIINSTMLDAKESNYKVDILHKAIDSIGLGTKITTFNQNLYDNKDILDTIANCDVLFGCLDSVDGRHLLNLLATFYLIPYFDLGVQLTSDGKGGINQIMWSVHYMQPGGSSLRTRGVYTDEELRAASMYRENKDEYEEQKKMGYIVDVAVDSPAVISINMQVASMAVNEFLARVHPFRYDSNSDFAITRVSFTDSYLQHEDDGKPDSYLIKFVGRGNVVPMLNMPELS